MDYDLNGLNPRDFEHLVQALALKAIAGGVTPFGDGPDGGREATYDGKMNYPSTADPWDGYLVIQAKFQKRSTGVVSKDGAWVLKELRSELTKFLDPTRNLRFPSYYLLATNVVLTPSSDSGTKDKVISVLEDFKTEGLKSYDVWDYDKICRLLDGHSEVYRHYAGFITSGDVLSKVMSLLEGQQADFAEVMSLFLQKELRNEQFVKLEQAGHTIDQKTSLAHVFVDLPVTDHPVTEPFINAQSARLGIVGEILQAGSRVLRASKCNSDEGDLDPKRTRSRTLGRYVVVGGPGQGKSTVGQFLSQMYRAAILQDCPAHTIAPEVRSVLNQIEKQCQQDQSELPTARRFPVRIVLDQFATDLANREVSSLINFVLKQIAVGSQRDCSADDLRRWLKFYPWLIVLDGLDEVPPTSNRSQVLEKITEFFSEVAVLDADILVVASTRPQGYNDEFSPRFYTYRYLSLLSESKALEYAQRLTQARYAVEPERMRKILRRLRLALSQETTARLMRTPLQVTIMATLVDQIGQPPQERWRLFQQYYEVIYRRETERDIPASRILQQRKADVNAIHNRVGLLLQTESEVVGNSEARLSAERFKTLVRSRIAQEGYDGEELELRVDEITQAALNRLVFLVGMESDRIGFEIRSLQEFTAAEALMDGGDSQIRARLEEIAASSHWRNVFLFAAGKCFAERQFLRDMVIGICDQLNDLENDKLAGATLAGSQLALDILQDGVAHEQPNFARSLARYALQILTTQDEALISRLSGVYTPVLEKLFKDELSNQICEGPLEPGGLWGVLEQLAAKNVSWAAALIDARWPAQRHDQIALFQKVMDELDVWARDKLTPLLPPQNPYEMPFLVLYSENAEDEFAQWAQLIRETRSPHMFTARLATEGGDLTAQGFRFRIKSVTNRSLTQFSQFHLSLPGWAIYQSAIRFEEDPCARGLGRELRWLSKFWSTDLIRYRHSFAWPLQACLGASAKTNLLAELADKAEKGELGELNDWIAAEQRWASNGVAETDLAYMTNDHWPFDKKIATFGFPFACHNPIGPARYVWTSADWDLLFHAYLDRAQGDLRSTLSSLVYRLLISGRKNRDEQIELLPSVLQMLCSEQSDLTINPRLFDSIRLPEPLNQEWIDLFEWLGNNARYSFSGKAPFERMEDLANEYQLHRKKGLLKVLGALVLTGGKCSVSSEILTESFPSQELKRAGLIIRASRGGWSVEEALSIAKEAAGLRESLNTIFYLLRTLENHRETLSHYDREILVLALRDQEVDTQHSRRWMRKSLNELIQSRPTALNDNNYWIKLGLPEKP